MEKSIFITIATLFFLIYSSVCFGISVFIVSGTVRNQDGTLAETGIEVEVTNKTKGLTKLTTVGKLEIGKYSVTFFDDEEPNKTVAEVGDVIEVQVTGWPTKSHKLTADDIAQACAIVDVQKVEGGISISLNSPVVANGEDICKITIIARDENGNPLSNVPIKIEVSGSRNSLDAPSSTDAEGKAEATLTSTKAETKTITITIDSVEQEPRQVEFVHDEVSVINIDASPKRLAADGKSISTITVTLKDAYDNLIDDEKLTIEADKGILTLPESKGNGIYKTTYTSAKEVGVDTITVTAENGKDASTEIELVPPTQPKITVNPSSSPVGSTITISGADYPENQSVGNIIFGEVILSLSSAKVGSIANNQVTTDPTGAFEVEAEVPEKTSDSTYGTHSIATSLVEDEIPANFRITGKITKLEPTEGCVGHKVSVEGNGYGSNEKVRIDFGNTIDIVTVNADEYGEFRANFTVDNQVYNPDGRKVTAIGLTSGEKGEASQPVRIVPKITECYREGSNETDLIVGETGVVEGNGFADGESIEIKIGEVNAEVTKGEKVTDKGVVETSFVVPDGEYPESPVDVHVETNSTSATLQDAITIIPKVTIQNVTVSPREAELGDIIQVTADGTPDAEASFLILGVPLATNISMKEEVPGTYVGKYTVQEGDDVQNMPVKVTLSKGERNVAIDESQSITIDTTLKPDFLLQCVQPEQITKISKSAAYIINVIGKNEFEGTIELENVDLPKEFETQFSNEGVITLSKEQMIGSVQLTVYVPDEAEAGGYDFKVRGLVEATGVFRELTGLKLSAEKLTPKITVLLDPPDPWREQLVKVHGNVILDLYEPDDKRTDLEIVLSYKLLPDGRVKSITTWTDKQRSYSEPITFNQPGKWQIIVSWNGNIKDDKYEPPKIIKDNKYKPVETIHEFDIAKNPRSKTEWLTDLSVFTEKGEAVILECQLTPNLKDEKITLKITHIDENTKEKTEDTEELTTVESGIATYNFPAEEVGEWIFQAFWEGNEGWEPCSSEKATVIVEGNPGKAILILGGNPQNSAFWHLRRKIIKRIEDTFAHRNFKVEDIAYLDFIENSPNLLFDENLPLKKRFELSITDWAKPSVSPIAPLYIYIIGHGEPEGVIFGDGSILTSEDLNDWLSELSQNVRITVVIESCYSGSFITQKHGDVPVLSRENRTIICSSRADNESHARSTTCFTIEFFKGIYNKKDIKTSFEDARELFESQLPQIDADGDGIPNEEYDDILAMKGVHIPYYFITWPEVLPVPEIVKVSRFGEINSRKPITVTAELTGVNIERVWIEVVTPDLQDELYIDLSDTQIDLVDDDGDGVYEAWLSDIYLPGKYSILFYAESSSGYSAQAVQTDFFVTFPDINQDGKIDIFDLVAVGRDFGKSGENLKSDVNGDGQVDIFDLVVVGKHFGETVPAAPAIIRSRRSWGSQRSDYRKFDRELLTEIYELLKSQPNPTPQMRLALSELKKLLNPVETELLQNYPNPFNPETWIPFQLTKDAEVLITIYDISGKLIRQIELGKQSAGVYVNKDKAAYWDGRNDAGERVSSGVYFYHLKAGKFEATRRMLIVK